MRRKNLSALIVAIGIAAPFWAQVPANVGPAKNVIIMIPDGMSVAGTTLTRWVDGGVKPLAMDELACALVRSYPSDAIINDSAPAGTAYACGITAQTGNIGEQEVYAGFDVVLGGGQKFFQPDVRKDKEDLVKVIKANYEVVTDTAAMKASKSAKLWGFFGMNGSTDLGYDLDRDPALVPSISEMTDKAIATLSSNKKGFVLMVEGSLIDWAAHANDPVGIVGDINAFDKAVTVAVDYAKKDKNTVVIVVTDHGNSGISIGNASTSSGYDTLKLSAVVDPLKKATRTAQGVADLINADRSDIAEVVAQYFGLTVSDDEIAKIKAAKDANDLRYVCQAVLGAKMAAAAKLGFTTGGHTGEDIELYVYSPKTAERPMGVVMNTDIARYMEKLLGTDLRALTARQFQLAPAAFAAKGAAVRFDFSDKANPVLVVMKGSKELKFRQNKSVAIVNGKETRLSGLVLYTGIAGGENWYVPEDAIELVD